MWNRVSRGVVTVGDAGLSTMSSAIATSHGDFGGTRNPRADNHAAAASCPACRSVAYAVVRSARTSWIATPVLFMQGSAFEVVSTASRRHHVEHFTRSP